MKALVEFIEAYRPGFAEEVVPADELDIELLEEHTGPLPGVYRRFLKTMGSSLGSLELADANFVIEGKIQTYQTMSWLRHGRCLYVAGDRGPSSWDYFLDRSKPHGRDDCMVIRMSLEEELSPDAGFPTHVGFEEFLYYEAFRVLRLSALPHRRDFSTPKDVEAAARYHPEPVFELAEALGFRRVSPAERCALYDRDDACLLLYRHPMTPAFSVSLGGEDPARMVRLAHDFEERIGLKGLLMKGG